MTLPPPLRTAQYGVGHGHAGGKMRSMRENADVEVVGIFEPEPEARRWAEAQPEFEGLRWFGRAEEMLDEPSVQAVAVEGRNDQSLAMAQQCAAAGKHLWYDKPAGDDWQGYLRLIETIRANKLYLQMGYMLRYHDAFRRVAEWAREGRLGDLFQLRAHMSTHIAVHGRSGRDVVARHRGGILYDLGGHMLDQVVWLMGRPTRVTSFLRNDATPELPAFADNTLGVFEYERGYAMVDIAAFEPRPMARRFEVYGTRGSAILLEPFEPGGRIRLVENDREELVETGAPDRQTLYDRELVAFVAVLRGEKEPDWPLEHEILVQETLLRATGGIPGG